MYKKLIMELNFLGAGNGGFIKPLLQNLYKFKRIKKTNEKILYVFIKINFIWNKIDMKINNLKIFLIAKKIRKIISETIV